MQSHPQLQALIPEKYLGEIQVHKHPNSIYGDLNVLLLKVLYCNHLFMQQYWVFAARHFPAFYAISTSYDKLEVISNGIQELDFSDASHK